MMNRTVLIVIALLVLAALGLYWLLSPQPILVETATVEKTLFQDTIEEDGRTRVRDRYIVSAPLSGRMQRMTLKPGDVVQTGEKLTIITPSVSPLLDPRVRRELEAQVGAADATVEESASLLEQAKVQLAQARADLDRTKQLAKHSFAPTAQLQREEFLVQSAQRSVIAAERRWHAALHILEHARAALTSTTDAKPSESFPVFSPIDGRVLRVMQESESVVSAAAPLVELGDLSDLEIAVDVLTTDAARIRAGDRVSVERWGGGADLEGAVRRVEPSGFTKLSALGVEEQRVWVIIDITSPPEAWKRLGDGYRVEAKILVGETDQATVLPIGALFRQGEAWHVFVVENGHAKLRKVEVRQLSPRAAEIAKGVGPGEMVVVYPTLNLTDGSKVRFR